MAVGNNLVILYSSLGSHTQSHNSYLFSEMQRSWFGEEVRHSTT